MLVLRTTQDVSDSRTAVQVLNLESKCADLQVNITALREEISERESVIAQNYTTIQLLRRRLADMEKHKFVLGYRTQVLSKTCSSASMKPQTPEKPSITACSSMTVCHLLLHKYQVPDASLDHSWPLCTAHLGVLGKS